MGPAFAIVVRSLLDPNKQRESVEFFITHADALADTVGAVEANPNSELAVAHAVNSIAAAIQTVSVGGRTITEFAFLVPMLERYQSRLTIVRKPKDSRLRSGQSQRPCLQRQK